jgi:hypothetical protein
MQAVSSQGAAVRKFDMGEVLAEWSSQAGLRFMDGDREVAARAVFSERSWLPMIVSRAELDASGIFQLAGLGFDLYEDSSADFGVAVKPVYVERNERNEFASVEQMLKAALLVHSARDLLEIHRMRQVVRIDERMRVVQGMAAGQEAAQAAQRRE